METHDFFWYRDGNNEQQGPQQDPVQVNNAITSITARDGMLGVNSSSSPTTTTADNALGNLTDLVDFVSRNNSARDWPALSSMLQREFNFSSTTVTNSTQAPRPVDQGSQTTDETESDLTPMEEAEWSFLYRNGSFELNQAYYIGLAVSDSIVNNLKATTKHTFNQLIFNARRRAESRRESLYASNDQESLSRIELFRLFELMLRDARFYFNSLTYVEQEYIPPLSSDGFTSGLRGVLLVDFLAQLLDEIAYEKSDYIHSDLRVQMRLLLSALLDTKVQLLTKLQDLEFKGEGFNKDAVINSWQQNDRMEGTFPNGFTDYMVRLMGLNAPTETWIEYTAGTAYYFDMSENARYYDEFDLFRRPLFSDMDDETVGSIVYPPLVSREVTPTLGAIPSTPLAPANQTRWELITREGSGFVGLRVNGVTVETLSSVRASSESGGLTKLSLEVYIVPGRSTLTFSSQLSDTIRNTEGNAPPVAGGSVNDRFMDL
jgi:hypothetical protein